MAITSLVEACGGVAAAVVALAVLRTAPRPAPDAPDAPDTPDAPARTTAHV